MDYLPLFFDVRDQLCLLVGGGEVAARKLALLLRAGARVRVVAPALCEAVAHEVGARVEHHARPFEPTDLDGCALAIAATADRAVNEHVAELAKSRALPVNVVDDARSGNFIFPSVIDRSPVQIAVSTGGASPVLARQLRTRLESCTPTGYGRLAELVESYRGAVKARFSSVDARRRFWEDVLEGPIAEQVFSGRDAEARALLEQALKQPETARSGEVFLVGAGPGDPDLLSFRALRLMQKADVVVYDRLVSPPILDLVRQDAERIYAGKARSNHTLSQESINDLLVRLAKEGKRVLRLKGGDPFIFGRGGEEISSLVEHHIPFQVVPGITAAAGCAAYAGIPLTHRDYAQACIFVTGHLKDGSVDLNWDMLAHEQQTVVFYMGLHGLSVICRELIAHGRSADTPAALVQQGTTPNQRVMLGTLASLPDLVAGQNIEPPTLIIVGEVVSLHDKLRWFLPTADVQAQGGPETA